MDTAGALVLRVLHGKGTRDDKVKFVIGTIISLVIMALIGTFHIWAGYVLTVIIVIYAIIPAKIRQTTEEPWQQVITCAVASIVNEDYKFLGVRPVPADEIETIATETIITPSGVKIENVQLEKNKPTLDENTDGENANIMKLLIQSKIKKRINKGLICGIPFKTLDGRFPIIYVNKARDLGTHYTLEIVYVNNKAAVQFILDSRKPKAAAKSPADDEY